MGVSKKHLHSNRANKLADMAKVLSHPARIAILDYIGDHNGCLCKDISEKIKLSQPTTSQHLQVIKASGLLKSKFQGRHQYYTLDTHRLSFLRNQFEKYFDGMEAKLVQL